ncbi:unnamed protein product [Prunus armeniaca]
MRKLTFNTGKGRLKRWCNDRKTSDSNQSQLSAVLELYGRDFGWVRSGTSLRVERNRSRGLGWPKVMAAWRILFG